MTTMPWLDWEDYRAGMYRTTSAPDPDRVRESAFLLTDPGGFRETAREMIRQWPNAARQNLDHMWTGRNAWIGQAACCYAHGATSAETRAAWGTLTNSQQIAANQVARTLRDERAKEVIDGAQTVFGF